MKVGILIYFWRWILSICCLLRFGISLSVVDFVYKKMRLVIFLYIVLIRFVFFFNIDKFIDNKKNRIVMVIMERI